MNSICSRESLTRTLKWGEKVDMLGGFPIVRCQMMLLMLKCIELPSLEWAWRSSNAKTNSRTFEHQAIDLYHSKPSLNPNLASNQRTFWFDAFNWSASILNQSRSDPFFSSQRPILICCLSSQTESTHVRCPKNSYALVKYIWPLVGNKSRDNLTWKWNMNSSSRCQCVSMSLWQRWCWAYVK